MEDENIDEESKEEVKETKPAKVIDFEITNLNGDSVQGELF